MRARRIDDIAVDDHRDRHRLLDRGHRRPVGRAGIELAAGAAVDGDGLDPAPFGARGQYYVAPYIDVYAYNFPINNGQDTDLAEYRRSRAGGAVELGWTPDASWQFSGAIEYGRDAAHLRVARRDRSHTTGATWSLGEPVHVAPGETTRVTVGGRGRPTTQSFFAWPGGRQPLPFLARPGGQRPTATYWVR